MTVKIDNYDPEMRTGYIGKEEGEIFKLGRDTYFLLQVDINEALASEVQRRNAEISLVYKILKDDPSTNTAVAKPIEDRSVLEGLVKIIREDSGDNQLE